MEEFLLGCDLARDKLNVVDKKNVCLAVFFLEGGDLVLFERIYKLVKEVLAFNTNDGHFGMLLVDLVCRRIHKVSFAETAGTVDEERIVVMLSSGIL